MLNEERGLRPLVDRLRPVLDGLGLDWEVIFVDDGSTDGTLASLKALNAQDRRLKAISLSRNFGKEIAIAAGLSYATGDAAVLIDADLQHPPELMPISSQRGARATTWSTGSASTATPTAHASLGGARLLCRLPETERHQLCPKAPATSACSTARRSMP